jgi:cephalosporin hydroxylase
MRSWRQYATSRLTEQQRTGLKHAVNFVLSPLRALRRSGIERRLQPLPDGRGWRSEIPSSLHFSIQAGTINYRYRDIPMLKHPVEVALYMWLLWKEKPKTIIEIGSQSGGAAVWMGDMLNNFGIAGQVISIDLTPPSPPYLPSNVTFLQGDANHLGRTLAPEFLATLPRPWLVIEDASHQYAATLAVLKFFDPLIQPNEYVIVEDGNVTEMGDDARFDGGPARAIGQFLEERGLDYEIDAAYCDHFGANVTGNPNGYLRRK